MRGEDREIYAQHGDWNHADIDRISTFHSEFGIQFKRFLISNDEPFLMHAGLKTGLTRWPTRLIRTPHSAVSPPANRRHLP